MLFAALRERVLARGRALHAAGRLDAPEDAVDLTLEELAAAEDDRSLDPRAPDDKLVREGDILVAHTTDPGWTPLFVNAAAPPAAIKRDGAVGLRSSGPGARRQARSGVQARRRVRNAPIEATREPTMTSPATAPPTTASSQPPERGRAGRFRRWILRGFAGLVALVVLAGAVTTALDARDVRRFPPPGDLVELSDGRMLHLQVAGEQHGDPTVVLDAGFGAFSPAFARVQDELATVATVVAYDRPGYGWSDPAGGPVDADATAADLHDALATRGLPAPYVLVGHSLGAHYVRVFAARFPDDVAGLVLLDPAHDDQFERVPEVAAQMQQMNRMLEWAPRCATSPPRSRPASASCRCGS